MPAAPTTLDELEELIIQLREHNIGKMTRFQGEDTSYEILRALARICIQWGRKIEIMRQLAQGLAPVDPKEHRAFAQKVNNEYFFVDEFDALKAAIFKAMRDRLSHSGSKT